MFTLCMSRAGQPALSKEVHKSLANKQVKGGYLLRYKRGLFWKGWCEEWVVLYEDSTLAWYSDKGLSRPKGFIRISEAPELLAVGEWTRQVPKRPRFPRACHIGQLLAIGSRAFHEVHWLMAPSPAEINDWMTAISNTLPPPPHLPLDDKRVSVKSPHQKQKDNVPNQRCLATFGQAGTKNVSWQQRNAVSNSNKYDSDHTVISAVCIDWGHGWGWCQQAWASEPPCYHETAATTTTLGTSSTFCHSVEDYTLGGYDEVDWSAFGDFCF